jgi:hypothetical protein
MFAADIDITPVLGGLYLEANSLLRQSLDRWQSCRSSSEEHDRISCHAHGFPEVSRVASIFLLRYRQ